MSSIKSDLGRARVVGGHGEPGDMPAPTASSTPALVSTGDGFVGAGRRKETSSAQSLGTMRALERQTHERVVQLTVFVEPRAIAKLTPEIVGGGTPGPTCAALVDKVTNAIAQELSLASLDEGTRALIRRDVLLLCARSVGSGKNPVQASMSLNATLEAYVRFSAASLELDAATPQGTELQSNVDARIARVDFQFQSERDIATLKSADKALPLEVDFSITVTKDKDLGALGLRETEDGWRLASGRSVRLVEVPEGTVYSAYARDDRVVMEDGRIVRCLAYQRSDHGLVDAIAESLGAPLSDTSTLYFEGGNLRATNNLLFVGSSDILNTLAHNKGLSSSADALALFEKTFGKKAIVVSPEDALAPQPQALFHIDLFLTPLSDNEVLLARLPKSHPLAPYLDQVEAQLLKQAPHLVIHRLDTALVQGVPMSACNMLVENDATSGTRTLYVPSYRFAAHLAGLKESLTKTRARLQEAQTEQQSNPTNAILADDVARLEKSVRDLEATIAEIAAVDEAALNAASTSQLENALGAGDTKLVIKRIDVDARHLLSWRNQGGSLNCLTNEARE